MRKLNLLIFTLTLKFALSANIPQISGYAKVTKNGEDDTTNKTHGVGPFTWLMSSFSNPNNASKMENVVEGRSGGQGGISITVSPVYVPPKIPELSKGEAVDYPTTKGYSTIDEEMVARLDSKNLKRNRAQDRFHPPAIFEHDIAHGNKEKAKQISSSSYSSASGPSDEISPISGYSSPIFPGSYDYKPPSYFNAKPMSSPVESYSPPETTPPKGPISFDSSPSMSPYGPPPSDSYGPPPDYPNHDVELSDEIRGSDYGSKPLEKPPKSIEYAGHFDHPAYVDDPYIHDHDFHHHDIIYDHLPDDHTTEMPMMMDQRLNKRPYSYYFIGKKLWYIPLYFSIYFIIYIAALILKSISRHKISFPHWDAESSRSYKDNGGPGWLDLTVKVIDGIATAKKAFDQKSA